MSEAIRLTQYSHGAAANSTIFSPCISLSGTSVINALTECQTISSRARFNTLESTVSTESAFAFTKNGALRNAESNESYFTFTKLRCFGMGVISSVASVIKAKVPSEPGNCKSTKIVSKTTIHRGNKVC